ncbi:MAG: hypothetical protein HY816_07820 [Candidatus Wallbacteria bacterium]|nr:hypothetical protein [Candidatus Wallbacteria bacterium]
MRVPKLPFWLLAALLAAAPLAADESSDALEQLLAEHPEPESGRPVGLPIWARLRLTAAAPPVLGEPFAVEAELEATLADLPDARFLWRLPNAVRLSEGELEGAVTLARGKPVRRTWKLVAQAPVSIVDGQLTLTLVATPPRKALLDKARTVSPEAAGAVRAELDRQAGRPQSVEERLEIAVSAREGFVGFTPLVWGAYLGGDGFYVGTGSFMDTNFAAQDLVADAERQILEGKPREALALLERARADLRPGGDADLLLRWEAANCEALCHYQTGNAARARELWKQSAADPALAELRRYALYNLGEAARLEGKPAEARGYFAESARSRPAFRLPLAKMR